MRANGVSTSTFRAAYAKTPPWEIGRPQRAIIEAAERGAIVGDVLDAGCGTGENALCLAGRGHVVLGVDVVSVAIDRAVAKNLERRQSAEFRVHDVRDLGSLGRRFDTVVDCGCFHTFSDDDRPRYVASLRDALRPGGRLILMCFSESETREGGPRRVTQEELRAAFADGWTIESIAPARFEANIFEDGARAWLASIRKDD
ncbi:MAG: class I SAM-dependent methyltransferase [Phycisphaerales bacterium]|nr:class I SAM-dependent methyltransferase [Phycisphaerales bacterium]MCB9857292.1 class I SAM-dependent methyltransferase [Phycisphaerales bacterium]MCB9862994.1 class I SAM-dependent methyltransferase [Phycisphaerales bacterium]